MNHQRINVVDALRGFALLGIMLLHALEHFDFIWPAELNPTIFAPTDAWVSELLPLLFSGKAYSIFSLMFGFSFFIQMNRAESNGIDYRARFAWRLVLLFIFGYLLSLIYTGQIFIIYALMGFPLLLTYRWNDKWLLLLAIVLMLQIPTLVNLLQTYLNPEFELQRTFGRGLWQASFQNLALGSFTDVIRFNSWKGHIAVISWTYYNGRYLQLLGLFIIGLVLGKQKFFENLSKYRKQLIIAAITSLVIFVALYFALQHLPKIEMPKTRLKLYKTLIRSYSGLALTVTYVLSIILIFIKSKSIQKSSWLANYGRMSLTNYTVQPLIGAPFFYGYGLAMYRYFGPTLSLFYGIVFLLLQLWFSNYWMKRYYYGPFEWLWRALTFFDFKLKFRK